MAKQTTMDERTIRTRLDFLGFTSSDAELLRSMKPWADQAINGFVKEFYDYQFKDPEFASIIRSNGATQDGLESAQAGYARMLFDGYPDMGYVNRRMAIGELHARINITPQWYITSYHFYFEMFYPRVREEAGEKADQAASALNKLLNFDQALIMDTYINGLMDQMRGLVTQVASTAVSLAEASGQLSTTAEQAGQAVQGIATTSQVVACASEEQSVKSTEVTNGMGQLSRAIEQVAQGSQQQASAVEQAAAIVNQVSTATQEVARNAQSAAEGSRQAGEAATAGSQMVEKTLAGMDKIKNAVDTASQRISGLGDQSAEIGKIVSV
ncbi:MAG: globin-coupled sensor protein, partial [Chloroflexi bacterium]|nr:globin-coupled sensor protein [Chloroflexota bacterium]